MESTARLPRGRTAADMRRAVVVRDLVLCGPQLSPLVMMFLPLRDQWCFFSTSFSHTQARCHIQTSTAGLTETLTSLLDSTISPLLSAMLQAMFFPRGYTAGVGVTGAGAYQAVGLDALFWFCAFVGRQLYRGEDYWGAEMLWTFDSATPANMAFQQYLLRLLGLHHAGRVDMSAMTCDVSDRWRYGEAFVESHTNTPWPSALFDARNGDRQARLVIKVNRDVRNIEKHMRPSFYAIWRSIESSEAFQVTRKYRAPTQFSDAVSRRTHVLTLLDGKEEFEQTVLGRPGQAPKFWTPSIDVLDMEAVTQTFVDLFAAADYSGRAALDKHLDQVRQLVSVDLVTDRALYEALVRVHLANRTTVSYNFFEKMDDMPFTYDNIDIVLSFLRSAGVAIAAQEDERVEIRNTGTGLDAKKYRALYTGFMSLFSRTDVVHTCSDVATRAALVGVYKAAVAVFGSNYFRQNPWTDSVELLRHWVRPEKKAGVGGGAGGGAGGGGGWA